jgi:hypothetical protein
MAAGQREFTVRGDGENLIDFMYVDDAVDGFLALAKARGTTTTVDFASACRSASTTWYGDGEDAGRRRGHPARRPGQAEYPVPVGRYDDARPVCVSPHGVVRGRICGGCRNRARGERPGELVRAEGRKVVVLGAGPAGIPPPGVCQSWAIRDGARSQRRRRRMARTITSGRKV